MAGVRIRDGRPPIPSVGQARDSMTGANEDETEISEAAKNLLKQQVQALSAKVEEVLYFLPIHCILVHILSVQYFEIYSLSVRVAVAVWVLCSLCTLLWVPDFVDVVSVLQLYALSTFKGYIGNLVCEAQILGLKLAQASKRYFIALLHVCR